MCNKDDYELESSWWGARRTLRLYLSDGTIDNIDGLIAMGAGGSAIYSALVQRGVLAAGALSSPIAAFVGGAILITWGAMVIVNNGCGVVWEVTYDPTVALMPSRANPSITPQ